MNPATESAGAATPGHASGSAAAGQGQGQRAASASTAHRPGPLPPDDAWRALHRDACDPYRRAGRFAWHFAQGKLGRDPAFRRLLERGELKPGARIVDIGCGQGLLASLLRAVDRFEASGHWPESWPPAPSATQYTGVDLLARDVQRAEAALAPGAASSRATAHFVCADMVGTELPACDTVVILDVLHYVDHDAQQRVLREVRRALQPGGRLLLRVGDAAGGPAFAITHAVDRVVTLVRSHRFSPMHTRPLDEWIALLQRLGFEVQSLPMSEGTPFANVLLVAEKIAEPRPASSA